MTMKARNGCSLVGGSGPCLAGLCGLCDEQRALHSEAMVKRVVLPSRIRRGRLAVSPVWRVTLSGGDVWQFQTRRAAKTFAANGGCGHGNADAGRCWGLCNGHRTDEASAQRIVKELQRYRRRLYAYREICTEAGLLPKADDEDLLRTAWTFIDVPDPADDANALLADFVQPTKPRNADPKGAE